MKPVVAIFAHPDDEAFGPAGTLALFAKERPVYLICVTNGDAGINSHSDKTRTLSEIRREELEASANILGIQKVFFLNYKDGTLCNNLYADVAAKIQTILDEIKPDTLLTYEQHGISGHLDHISVSMITSYVFEHRADIQELWYFAATKEEQKIFRDQYPDFFVYIPEGYEKKSLTFKNVSSVWEQKLSAMRQHESQTHDITRVLAVKQQLPQEEGFIIRKK
jgi:LmbE family N-acetylglucosaminyl deacetylase